MFVKNLPDCAHFTAFHVFFVTLFHLQWAKMEKKIG